MTRICGRPWEQIQAMQQGRTLPTMTRARQNRPTATDEDKALLAKHGVSRLEEMRFHGVLDRLEASGLIPAREIILPPPARQMSLLG